MGTSKKTITRGETPHNAAPLVSKITRMRHEDLDPILAGMRITEDNERRARKHLVDGRSMRDIAIEEGCSPQLVGAAVSRVRLQINKSIGAWAYVTVSLTLPLTLAEDLRGLCDSLSKMQDVESANAILKDVQRSIAVAKTKLIDCENTEQ